MSEPTSEERMVEQLLDLIEKGCGRKLMFASIVNLKTGERTEIEQRMADMIRSHTNALVAGAYGVCANYLAPYTIHFDNPQIDVREAVQNEIRSLTPADAAQELERIKEAAHESGMREGAQNEALLQRMFDEEGPMKQELERRLQEAERKGRLEGIEEYKRSLSVPELEDFAKGVIVEAQHQRQRWGDEHDTTKEPEEWFWVVGYLAGKGLQAQRSGDIEKFKHHLITGAAILANWHAREKERIADLSQPKETP